MAAWARFAEPYIPRRAERHLEKGRVVIFGHAAVPGPRGGVVLRRDDCGDVIELPGHGPSSVLSGAGCVSHSRRAGAASAPYGDQPSLRGATRWVIGRTGKQPPDVDDDAATQSRPSLHETNRLSSKERSAESHSVFAEVEGWAIVPVDTVRAGAQDARRRRRPTTKLTKSLANVTSRLAPPARTFRCGAPCNMNHPF